MVVGCTVLNFLVYKAMTQTSLLQRAKQGDAEAIASVINYLIKDKKIIAKASVNVFLKRATRFSPLSNT